MHSVQRAGCAALVAAAIAILSAFTAHAALWNADASFQPALERPPLNGGDAFGAYPMPDGSVLIQSDYRIINGHVVAPVVHLLADGSVDLAFAAPAGIRILEVCVDGKILACSQSSPPLPNLVYRLLSNGAIDTSFHAIAYTEILTGTLSSKILPDGSILLVGLNSADERSVVVLARFGADGTFDSTFTSPFSDTATTIFGIAAQPDGKVLLVGQLKLGSTVSAIMRLDADGSVDSQFNPSGFAPTDQIGRRVCLLPSGQILASANSLLVRLNADGSLDSSQPAASPNLFGAYSFASSGRAYYFDLNYSTGTETLHRLNADGTVDSGFSSGPFAISYAPTLPSTWDESRFYFPWPLTSERSAAQEYLSQVDASGAMVTAFAPRFGVQAQFTTLGRLSDGSYLLEGTFSAINGTSVSADDRVVRLAANGSLVSSFSLPGGSVFWTESDGHVLTKENVSNGTKISRIAPDGSLVTSFVLPTSTNPMTEDDSGHVYGLAPDNSLARYNADGTLDASFTAVLEANTYPKYIVPSTNGAMYVLSSPIQAGASIWIQRLLPSGAMDPNFSPMQISAPASYGGPPIIALPDGGFVWIVPFQPNRSGIYQFLEMQRFGPHGGQVSYACTIADNAFALAGLLYDQLQAFGMDRISFAGSVQRNVHTSETTSWMEVRADGQLSVIYHDSTRIEKYQRSAAPGSSLPLVPQIITQPLSYSAPLGSFWLFSVAAAGEGPFTYQWLFNGKPINDPGHGSNLDVYWIDNVQSAGLGAYSVVVSNRWGSVTSQPAILSFADSLSITTQPQDMSVKAGWSTKFQVASTAGIAVSFQWQVKQPGQDWVNLADGGIYSGTQTSSLGINAASAALNGLQYRCVLTNSYTAISNPAKLTVAATDYSGTYFGTFVETGGRWALRMNSAGKGVLLAGLTDLGRVVTLPVTVDGTGVVRSTHSTGSPLVSFQGNITNDGWLIGSLPEIGVNLGGVVDSVTPVNPIAGSYTASATGKDSGTLYAVVAESGQSLFVISSDAGVDAALATMDGGGSVASLTDGGTWLALTANSSDSTLGGMVTTMASGVPIAYTAATLASPTVSWQPGAAFAGGVLSSIQLDASASVSGKFAYSPAAGAALVEGSQMLSATFVPDDPFTYASVTTQTSLTVRPAQPTADAVFWQSPNDYTGEYAPYQVIHDGQGGVFFTWTIESTGLDLVGGKFVGQLARLRESDGSRDPAFRLDRRIDRVTFAAVQPDGKIVLAADVAGAPTVVRVDATGALDPSFVAPYFAYDARALTLQSDGKILIAADDPATPASVPARALNPGNPAVYRLDADGSLDSSFTPAVMTNGGVIYGRIVVDAQGRIYLTGGFTAVNGVPRLYIARLTSTGALDSGFGDPAVLPAGFAGTYARGVGLQSDGRIVVPGAFRSTARGTSSDPIVAIRFNADGTFDSTFAQPLTSQSGLPAGSRLRGIVMLANDKFMGAADHTVRFNADGTPDTTFPTHVLSGIPVSITIGANGRIFEPDIPSADGQSLADPAEWGNGVFTLNLDGTVDHSFHSGGWGRSDFPSSVNVLSDGRYVIGGPFNHFASAPLPGVAVFGSDGRIASVQPAISLANAVGVPVCQVADAGSDQSYVIWTDADSTSYNPLVRLARVRSDGTLDTAYKPQIPDSFSLAVSQLVGAPGGKLILASSTPDPQQVLQTGSSDLLVRLAADGSVDSGFTANLPNFVRIDRDSDQSVQMITVGSMRVAQVLPDGRVLVILAGIDGALHLVRLSADGNVDATFQAPSYGTVAPSTGYTVPIAPEYVQYPYTVYSLPTDALCACQTADGKVYVGGTIAVKGAPHGLIRLNTDGSLDSTFTGVGAVYDASPFTVPPMIAALTTDSAGRLYVAGRFDHFNGQATPGGLFRIGADGAIDPYWTTDAQVMDYPTLDVSLVEKAGKIHVFGTVGSSKDAFPTGHRVLSEAFAVPTITTSPVSTLVTPGGSATLSVVGSGGGLLTYQWYKDGIAIAGATNATLTLPYVFSTDAGAYTVKVSNDGGSATSDAATLSVSAGSATLVNMSARVYVGADSLAATQTLTIEGSAPRQVLLRAVGASLTSQGLAASETLLDPVLSLYDGTGALVARNDDWGSGSATDIANASAQVGASAFASTDTTSSALLLTLAPGIYTARVEGKSGKTGIVLLESYTIDPSSITYLSTRGRVGTGDNLLIGGFVVSGSSPALVLVRGLGPALAATVGSSALSDPVLEIHDVMHNYATIATNDNWGDNADRAPIAAAAAAAGLASLDSDSKDAAVLLTLPPGVYTFLLTGKNATSGVGQIEVAQVDASMASRLLPAWVAPTPDQSVIVGQGVTLSAPCVARPVAVTYQWFKQAAGGAATAISGAVSPTLVLSNLTLADSAGYYVTMTNAAGITTTSPVAVTVSQLSQTIAFSAISGHSYGDAPLQLGTLATASSGLELTFEVVSGPAKTQGGTLIFTGAGTVTLRANQAGTASYAPVSKDMQISVAPAELVVTADAKTRIYGTDNPALSMSYSGFVNGDTVSVLTELPVATTNATAASLPGVYPITLTGGASANYSFALNDGALTVTPRDYSGAYFGTFSDGTGHWALKINGDGTGTFIAYLPERHSAIIAHLTVDPTGAFTVTGTETIPQSLPNTLTVRSVDIAGHAGAAATASAFTLSAHIALDGAVSGSIDGVGVNLTGAGDTTTGSAAFYTASALGTSGGSTYAIIGPSGQTVVVTTSSTSVDGATGTVDAGGSLSTTTATGAQLSLSVDSGSQSLAASITPAGSSTPVTYAGLGDGAVASKRLVNISARGLSGTGNNVTIGGFVVAGNGSKKFLIRGVGPTLTTQGIGTTEVMLDPTMDLHDVLHGTVLASNDNWGDNSNAAEITSVAAQIGAATLDASDTKSAAMLVTLAPGVYSFVVSGKANTSGVVLAEVYDAETSNLNLTLVNISARARATTGNGVAIGGFVVSGNAPKKILIRGVGPTLTTQGIDVTEALADPVIEVHDALHGQAIVATNDNWTDNANATDITATAARVGATPLASTDTKSSALLLTLQPGVYSFIASGKNNTSGIVLVEVYDAD